MLMPMLRRNNWFDDFFGDFADFGSVTAPASNSNLMKTDVRELEDSFSIEMDLPGFKKEDVKAHVKDGYLVVQAESSVNNDEKDEDGKFLRRERFYGSCQRSFYVGDAITEEDIKAKFEDGVLKMSIPKKDIKAVEEPKYIAIEG